MRRAIELSLANVESGLGGPFAAVVVKSGRIVGEGANRVTSLKDPSAHAEVMAIRAACLALDDFQLSGCDIYTTCEPCPMCMGLIYWARLDRVFFGNTAEEAAAIGFDDSRIYRELCMPHDQRAIPMVRFLHEETRAAFDAWQRKPDKTPY